MMLPLNLILKDVRAVHSVNLHVDGLTVLCGANATGKSTVAQTLFQTLDSAICFRAARRVALLRGFMETIIIPLSRCSVSWTDRVTFLQFQMDRGHQTLSDMSVEAMLAKVKGLGRSIEVYFSKEGWQEQQFDSRYVKVLMGVLKLPEDASRIEIEGEIRRQLEDLQEQIRRTDSMVPTYETFADALGDSVLWTGEAALLEGGEYVFAYEGRKVLTFSDMASVRRVFYIESPFATEISIEGNALHVGDKFAADLIQRMPKAQTMDALSRLIHELIGGSVELAENPESGQKEWMYVRNDGVSFPLRFSASGIRAVSTVARLNDYGLLDGETVLILDEPEAHLHPEWVVAYAHILVQLVQKRHVRIVLASHSPDMINALKAFALAADLNEVTHFYQAVESGDGAYSYDFAPRELSIEEIFDSFNRVYDLKDMIANLLRDGE